ncbi:hypothetical protein [Pedobacter sp. Leaf132]|uniref:hypothetical protein n=1 Tax=Pedobacter sp. Leaf132 TaxID=2876557 RepID=UPI001E643B7F|nr:hypothetical protein [Pedobacter sp. Leaf132]
MEKTLLPWEQAVLDVALEHIRDNELWSDELYPESGFHLMPRPMECKVDAVELNLLCCQVFEATEDYDENAERYVDGVINVNVFHTDLNRVAELTQMVERILEDAYVEGFLFTKEFSRMFKQGHSLFYNNIRFEFAMNKEEFEQRFTLTH